METVAQSEIDESKKLRGPSTPWWWQTYQFISNPYRYLRKNARDYGDAFIARLFHKFTIFSHPQAAQEIFTSDIHDLYAGKANFVLLPILGSDSLLLLDSDHHLRMRRLMTPPFHGRRMRLYGETIREAAEKVFAQCENGSPVVIQEQMQAISFEVILRAVFGIKQEQQHEKFQEILISYLNLFTGMGTLHLYVPPLQKNWGPFSTWGRYLRKLREVDELLYGEIKKRRAMADPGDDILTMMLQIRDEDGQPMSDKELRDQLLTLLLAGHETTASALAWCFYWIHHTPGILEQIDKELEKQTEFDPEAVAKLQYLDAVCKETLRLYPVVPGIGRVLQKPMTVMGYPLSAGMGVSVNIYLIHHREDLYPEPDLFRPERFIERHYSPYEYLPFGGGVRRCIGAAFAQYEMKIVLFEVLSKYRFQLVHSGPVAIRRKGPTISPADGVPMVIQKR